MKKKLLFAVGFLRAARQFKGDVSHYFAEAEIPKK
jgi:hypothetical protein